MAVERLRPADARDGAPGRLALVSTPACCSSPTTGSANTPTGLIPQLDRSYFIAAMQLPPGSTLERSDRLVRQASELIMGTPGVQNAVAFVGFDGATFTNSPNAGVIFVPLKPFAERADIPKDKILAELRGKMFSLREAFVFVLEPPSVPGHRHRRRPQGLRAGPRRARPAGARGRDLGAGRRGRPDARPDPGLHPVQHADAADLGRDRPHQGRAARRADRQRVPDAVGLHGLGLRQRLQHPRPHLSRDGAGRQSLSPHRARRRQPQDAQRQRRDGADRLGRDLQRHRPALPRGALQSLSAAEVQVALVRGFSPGQGIAAMEGLAEQGAALGLRLRMDRDRAAGKARRQHAIMAFGLAVLFVFLLLPRSTRAGCCRSPSS
jgi:hypothetical protein